MPADLSVRHRTRPNFSNESVRQGPDLSSPAMWLLSASGLTNDVVIAGDRGRLADSIGLFGADSSGRGPSFHPHLYPAKLVRSIGP